MFRCVFVCFLCRGLFNFTRGGVLCLISFFFVSFFLLSLCLFLLVCAHGVTFTHNNNNRVTDYLWSHNLLVDYFVCFVLFFVFFLFDASSNHTHTHTHTKRTKKRSFLVFVSFLLFLYLCYVMLCCLSFFVWLWLPCFPSSYITLLTHTTFRFFIHWFILILQVNVPYVFGCPAFSFLHFVCLL